MTVWQDLFVANIDQELFSLYHNEKDETFTDDPGEIGQATRQLSGWGLKFFDYDDDGDPDLILANGHPDDMVEIRIAKVRYKEPLLLFQNTAGKFKDVSSTSGPVFAKSFSARGLAVADFDNDGDLDVVVSDNGGPPILLRNDGGNRNAWVGLELVATKSNPEAQGAIITWKAGGRDASTIEDGRRELSGVARSSRDPRTRECRKGRLHRNPVAERCRRSAHGRATGQVHQGRRRPEDDGATVRLDVRQRLQSAFRGCLVVLLLVTSVAMSSRSGAGATATDFQTAGCGEHGIRRARCEGDGGVQRTQLRRGAHALPSRRCDEAELGCWLVVHRDDHVRS